MKRLLYQLLALSNDINAIRRGRVGRRVADMHERRQQQRGFG